MYLLYHIVGYFNVVSHFNLPQGVSWSIVWWYSCLLCRISVDDYSKYADMYFHQHAPLSKCLSPFFTLKPFLHSNFHSFIHPVVDILQNSHVEASLKLLVSAFISFYMCTHTEPLASFTSLCQDLCHFWWVQNL